MQQRSAVTVAAALTADRCCEQDYPYPPHLPALLSADFGEPLELCHSAGDGRWERRWSKATVQVDCPRWEGSITLAAN